MHEIKYLESEVSRRNDEKPIFSHKNPSEIIVNFENSSLHVSALNSTRVICLEIVSANLLSQGVKHQDLRKNRLYNQDLRKVGSSKC